jgi:hypothetical protein
VPASYNGVPMFGVAVTMTPAEFDPVDHQQTSVAGLDGFEETRLGDRGAWTQVEGWLGGATPADLASAINVLRSARNAGYCTFIDLYGQVWPLVRFHSYQMQGRVIQDPSSGFWQKYAAKLWHPFLP